MKNILIVLVIVLCASTVHATTSITQHGITWTFIEGSNYTTGQFINGDYWVVDPGGGVKITNISPGYTVVDEVALNGSMVNPIEAQSYYGPVAGGYNADRHSGYKPDTNVGIGISPSTPLTLLGNSSLVSTVSNTTITNPWVESYIKSAAILTVLTAAPPAGSFRPGMCGTNKTLHNANDLDRSLLKNLSTVGTRPDIAALASKLQMPFLDHIPYDEGRVMHPSDSGLDNYYFVWDFATAALVLHSNYTALEKEKLLVNFVQLGIDAYSFIENGGLGWIPAAGHGIGRKWPIMFAGIMLNYPPMKNIGQVSGDFLYASGHGPGNPPADYVHFGEDGQTFYVAQSDVTITNGATWTPDTRSAPNYPYTAAMIGMPEWGLRYATNPEQSDSSWGANYRSIGTAVPLYAGHTLAARIMGVKNLWNHNALFDYVDRYMAISLGKSDPFGFTVQGEVAERWPWDLFPVKMWDTYRRDYPYPPYARRFRNVRLHTKVEP